MDRKVHILLHHEQKFRHLIKQKMLRIKIIEKSFF